MSVVPESLRLQIRERAEQRCEYCHKPESVEVYPFHIEHIIPLKHDGTSEPENLAWACFQCNVAKGTDIAGYDTETGDLTPLYNPRTQPWGDHFQLHENGMIEGITPIGRVTVRLLQINASEQVEIRLRLIDVGLW